MSLKSRWAVAVFLAATAASMTNAYAQPQPGQGSLGMRIGVPYFTGDADTKLGQKPRMLISANFGYRFSPGWRLMTDFGFGWVVYKDDELAPYKVVNETDSVATRQDLMTKIVPIDATLIRNFNPDAKKWSPYAGVGFTINRMEIDNQRRKIQDPATFKPWVDWAPGIHAILGQELFIPAKPTVGLDFSIKYTYLMSKNEEDFPSGFTDNDSFLAFNFGVNVHFWPGGKPVEVAPAPVPEAAPESLTPAPTPAAPSDTTGSTPPSPAPQDTTQHAPSPQQAPPVDTILRTPPADETSFGAFGVTLPRSENEGDACIVREKRAPR